MKIERLKVSEVKENPNNTRSHNDGQIDALIKSLQTFSQYRPVVVDENNMVLAGHAIILAKQKMGDEYVDVYRIGDLTENEKKKLLIVDNKIQSMGWDNYGKIDELIKEIGEAEIIGFDDDYIQLILAEGDTEETAEYFSAKDEEIFGSRREDSTSVDVEGIKNVEYDPSDFKTSHAKEIICPHCKKTILLE